MDAKLHQKQGINHLNKVLNYAPFVAEDGKATVHLTFEDWNVVADTLFHMNTPKDVLPEAINAYRLTDENRAIELDTDAYLITVEMI